MALGGADLDARAAAVAADLGLPAAALDREVATLSGGQAARAQLAALLLARFDVFLLDEPTNDLDLDGLDRLERFVLGLDAPLMVVSHDRAFLERTITAVAEIDDHAHSLTRYEGGWLAYLDERALTRQHAEQAYRVYTDKRGSPDRAGPHPAAVGQPGRAPGEAVGRDRQVHPPPQHAELRARGGQGQDHRQGARPPRRGRQAVGGVGPAPHHRRRRPRRRRRGPRWPERASVERRPRALEPARARGVHARGPVSLEVALGRPARRRRAATARASRPCSAALFGRLPLASGSPVGRAQRGGGRDQPGAATCSRGRRRCSPASMPPPASTTAPTARSALAKFGLAAEHVERPPESLSPGERTRATLAVLQVRGVNVLVLDEPTNHLDLEAVEQLEQAIEGFGGTLVLVTHDRTHARRRRHRPGGRGRRRPRDRAPLRFPV